MPSAENINHEIKMKCEFGKSTAKSHAGLAGVYKVKYLNSKVFMVRAEF